MRLNKNKDKNILKELIGSALVRELHVYGSVIPVAEKNIHTQHTGLGKKLMKMAEIIAKENKFDSIAVISAIGTRGYYKKLGYNLNCTYMIKNLSNNIKIKKNYINNWFYNKKSNTYISHFKNLVILLVIISSLYTFMQIFINKD